MSLPEQLQKQVDSAKAIIEQHYGQKPGDESPPTEPTTPAADPTPEADAPPAEAPVAEAATPALEVQPAQPTVTHDDPDENSATYAQRWRSLQGVYNATKRQMDEAQSRIANLEQLIAQMQSAKTEASIPQPSKHVTDKDVTEYGNDMVEFARRVSREEMAPLAQAVQMLMSKLDQVQQVVPVVQNVAAAQAKSAHELFYDNLTKRVSDWRTVNENPKFHEWLLSADPLSGLQRQTLLTDAHNNLDLDRVVNIFEMGKQALGFTPAPTAAAPAAPARPSNVSKLEKQIAPGRASTGSTPPQPAEKKQWTRTEISKFFADKMQGRYKGREAEAQAMERDIFAAQREGRVALNAA